MLPPFNMFFVSRLNIIIWCLLDTIQINQWANHNSSIVWINMVVIYREQLSEVALVPTRFIEGASSTMNEVSVSGSVVISSNATVSAGQAAPRCW